MWADFVSVSGSVLFQLLEQQQQLAPESVRCAVQNSKLWVCIIGSVSVFFAAVIIRLTAQSDSRALYWHTRRLRFFLLPGIFQPGYLCTYIRIHAV